MLNRLFSGPLEVLKLLLHRGILNLKICKFTSYFFMDKVSLNKEKKSIINAYSKSFKKDFNSDKSETTNSSDCKNGFKKRKKFDRKGRGVLYLGRIPHGFYEDEMRSYFKQFGKVRATYVARSRKTGRSRGFGFVEFDDDEVAKIAAESMNNYLMYNRILKCRYIPPEERKLKTLPRTSIIGDYPRKRNRILNLKSKREALSNLNQSTYLKKTLKKINEFKKFFDERGIDFNFKFSSASQVSNSNSKSRDGSNDRHGVLETNESDQEISFETSPKVKKIIKRSSNSPSGSLKNVSCDSALTEKEIKSETLINSNSKNTPKIKEIKKKNKKTDVGFKKINQKDKSQSGKLKGKKKLLVKSTENRRLRSSKEDISAALKQKNAKILKSNDVGVAKKGKHAKQRAKISDSKVSNKRTKIEIIM